MILNKLIKSKDKCNPKTKTYFYYAFHPSNSKSAKKCFLQIQIQNMFANDTNSLL